MIRKERKETRKLKESKQTLMDNKDVKSLIWMIYITDSKNISNYYDNL